MKLTKRGRKVVGILFFAYFILALGIVSRIDAQDVCAVFQADNNYQAALDAGCSFDMMYNGEYPYQWEVNN
jgi:exopolysaccharide biosynthesis protein